MGGGGVMPCRNPGVRYWVSAGSAVRGGWELRKVIIEADGRERDGGLVDKYKTKRLAQAEAKRLNKTRRNPEEEAAAAYESFHGTPATRVDVIETEHHYHGFKAEAGRLVSLEILQADGATVVPIEFEDGVLLTFDENGTQLFIDGGDQELDLEALGIRGQHEQVVIGPVYAVVYFTAKYHLKGGKGPGTYRHEFGRRGSGLPTLCYDARNKQLSLWGGVYTIDDVGIVH